MTDELLVEVLIDMQAEIKALQECLRLDADVPLLTIQARRDDAMLPIEREQHRADVLARLAELRTLSANVR